MARFLSFYAKNKILDDKLYKKEEKISQDHKYVMYRHAELTSRVLKDLVHIHIKTPNLHKEKVEPENDSINFVGEKENEKSQAGENRQRIHQKPFKNLEDVSNFGATRQPIGSLYSPRVEIHNSKVYYQYKCSQWKRLNPSERTRILLHKADSVERILRRVNRENPQFINTKPQHTSKATAAIQSHSSPTSGHYDRCANGDNDGKTFELDFHANRLPSIDGISIRNFYSWKREISTPVWYSKKRNGSREYLIGRSKTSL